MECKETEILKPSFWAVIPATVRYDEKVGSTAKLLYAEITALSNAQGYCWASNEYFGKLFNITPKQASRLIADLCERGFLKSYIDGQAGNQRKLYPQSTVENEPMPDTKRVKTLAERFEEQVGPVVTELADEKKAFLDYWTAKNDGGKKEHWQKQTTFAMRQRWATWKRNKRDWSKPSQKLPTDDELRKSAKREADRKGREEAERKERAERDRPRTPEEQARIDKQLAIVRESLKNKFSIKQ